MLFVASVTSQRRMTSGPMNCTPRRRCRNKVYSFGSQRVIHVLNCIAILSAHHFPQGTK
jgi:hypothetical protein